MSSTRSVKQYSFKNPDLTRLRELCTLVKDPSDFRHRHGKLLDLLKVKIEKGILETLVQFYDPVCHCFTFPDYQLVPTLEEYSFWVGLPILEREPFNGLEFAPKTADIAKALHLKHSDLVHPHYTIKNGFQGLTAKFLYEKATTFARDQKTDAFESILALLIYGLFLFPNMDNFVDINAIKIFLTKNPVPTLLAETYHSIHYRTLKEGGLILCCAPLLHRWFTSHLPSSVFSKTNSERSSWSQRIMPLTPADIVWVHASANSERIIDSCGEFPNVPLIGAYGGITYHPALAMRQFGYPMNGKPINLSFSGEFYLNSKDPTNLRRRFVEAWRSVRKLDSLHLGKKMSFVHESYTQWVIDRAMTFGIPYALPRLLSSTTPEIPLPLPPSTMEEYRGRLHKANLESVAWRLKYQTSEREKDTIMGILEQTSWQLQEKERENAELKDLLRRKDAIIDRMPGSRRRRREFFAGATSDSEE